jgi:ferric-dicitrate binding protein FerR (iron transport regulator)
MSDSSVPPSDPGFEERERITANLRFRSLPAAQRTLLGLVALVPPRQRGLLLGLLLFVLGVLAALAARSWGPSLVDLVKGAKP